MNEQQRPEFLTRQEVSTRLRTTQQRIIRLERAGEVPSPIRIGGRVLYSAAELEAWLAAKGGKVKSGAASNV